MCVGSLMAARRSTLDGRQHRKGEEMEDDLRYDARGSEELTVKRLKHLSRGSIGGQDMVGLQA
jgi:hypothetical protein